MVRKHSDDEGGEHEEGGVGTLTLLQPKARIYADQEEMEDQLSVLEDEAPGEVQDSFIDYTFPDAAEFAGSVGEAVLDVINRLHKTPRKSALKVEEGKTIRTEDGRLLEVKLTLNVAVAPWNASKRGG